MYALLYKSLLFRWHKAQVEILCCKAERYSPSDAGSVVCAPQAIERACRALTTFYYFLTFFTYFVLNFYQPLFCYLFLSEFCQTESFLTARKGCPLHFRTLLRLYVCVCVFVARSFYSPQLINWIISFRKSFIYLPQSQIYMP